MLASVKAETNEKCVCPLFPLTTVTQTLIDPVNVNGTLTSHCQYDIAGNITKTLDPGGVEHDYDYTDSGNTYALPTTVTSYTGLNTSGSFSSTPTGPLSATVQYDYNIAKPTSTTDINGKTTGYSYADLLNRLYKITRPDGGTTTFVYTDTPGSLTVETKVDQNAVNDGAMQSYVYYDGLGRETETSKLAGTQNIFVCKTWDGRGRLYQESNPAFSACGTDVTTYAYDGLNRKLRVTAPDGSAWNYGYGSDSTTHTNRTAENDPTNHSHLQYFDAAGRLKQVDENPTSCPGISCGVSGSATYSTTYTYDALDSLSGVSQSGQSRTFTYDSLKRLVQAQNPESGILKYKYDNSGNLSTRTDANGSILIFGAWDGLNRATSKSYTLGTGVAPTSPVSYTYDVASPGCSNLGRLTSVTSGSQANNYSCYDWAGRVRSSSQVTGGTTYAMSYGYDLAGELISFTFPSTRQQTNTYDSGGRISGVSGSYQSANTTYTSLPPSDGYFANGAIQHMNLGPNSLVQQYCQNNRLQTIGARQAPLSGGVTTLCANSGSGSSGDPLNLGITYGTAGANNGNVSAETIQTSRGASVLNLTQNFTYDAYNRLVSAGETGGVSPWSQTYGHDAFGNHWVSNSSFALNVLTPLGQNWFNQTTNRLNGTAYDLSGNQQQLGPFAVTYDAENRMAAATAPNPLNLSVSYTYDGEGRRVSKSTVSNGTTYTTTYVYDAAGQLVAESGNEPIDSGTPPATQYLVADHLGSTRMSMDASASSNSIRRYDYLPFGEEIWAGTDGRSTDYNSTFQLSATQDAANNKFTGKERDAETGLDYFDARYFSAAQGRFTTSDWSAIPAPVPYANLADPQTLNLYAYVRNNPLSRADRDGHAMDCSGKKAQGVGCQYIAQWNAEHGISQTILSTPFSHLMSAVKSVSSVKKGNSGGITWEDTTTTTTKANYSTKNGHEGDFLGATTQTQVMRRSESGTRVDWTIVTDTGEQQITWGQAVRAIGASQMEEAQDLAVNTAFDRIFLSEMGKDIANHPFKYAIHAAAFALPFTEIPQAVEGLLTGIEDLMSASDLQKEAHEQQ